MSVRQEQALLVAVAGLACFLRQGHAVFATSGGHGVVCENRVAPLLVYCLIGFSALVPSWLRVMPEGVVDGILAYVGLDGLLHGDNQFVARLLYLLSDRPSVTPSSTTSAAGA